MRSCLFSSFKLDIDPKTLSIEMLRSGIRNVVINKNGSVTNVSGLINSGISQYKIKNVIDGISSG